jgi:MFS family permease
LLQTKLTEWNRLGGPFRAVITADGLMLLALMVAQVAVPWWIAHEGGPKHLALYAGSLALVSFLALPVLSPLGDRVSKQVLLTVGLMAMLLESLLMATMAQVGVYRIEWILLLGVLQQVAMAVITPVSFSIAAELLPPNQLSEGLGYQRSAQALGRLLGPVVGGAILAAADTAAALWVNASLLALACLLASRILLPARQVAAASVAQWMHDLRAGMLAKWKIPTERGWTFVSFLVMIFFGPGIGMLVPLKVQSLGLSGAWLGACEVGLSLGLLLGSLGGSAWLAARVGRFRASTGAILAEGLSLSLLGWTHQPWLLVVALALIGGCVATVQTVGHTHRMLAMPQDFRARMTSVNMMVMQVAGVLGPGLAGVGLAVWHVDHVYLAFGAGLFLVGLGYRWVPGYRRFLGLPHDEAAGFYGREYPALFKAGARKER